MERLTREERERWVAEFNNEAQVQLADMNPQPRVMTHDGERVFSHAGAPIVPSDEKYFDMSELEEQTLISTTFLAMIDGHSGACIILPRNVDLPPWFREPLPNPYKLARLCAAFASAYQGDDELWVRKWWGADAWEDHDRQETHVIVSARLAVRKLHKS